MGRWIIMMPDLGWRDRMSSLLAVERRQLWVARYIGVCIWCFIFALVRSLGRQNTR